MSQALDKRIECVPFLYTVLATMIPHRFEDEESARQLWKHSLAVQMAVKLLSTKSGAVNKSVALTVGLLHDLGWVVLMAFRPDLWASLRVSIEEEGLTLTQAEERVGFCHQKAGLALAKQWDLPPLFAQVMGRHHQPEVALPFATEIAWCTWPPSWLGFWATDPRPAYRSSIIPSSCWACWV